LTWIARLDPRDAADRQDAANIDAAIARALGDLDVLEADLFEQFAD
jgi:hypothetical protein